MVELWLEALDGVRGAWRVRFARSEGQASDVARARIDINLRPDRKHGLHLVCCGAPFARPGAKAVVRAILDEGQLDDGRPGGRGRGSRRR